MDDSTWQRPPLCVVIKQCSILEHTKHELVLVGAGIVHSRNISTWPHAHGGQDDITESLKCDY